MFTAWQNNYRNCPNQCSKKEKHQASQKKTHKFERRGQTPRLTHQRKRLVRSLDEAAMLLELCVDAAGTLIVRHEAVPSFVEPRRNGLREAILNGVEIADRVGPAFVLIITTENITDH